MQSILKPDVDEIVSFLSQKGYIEAAQDVRSIADNDSESLALYFAVYVLRAEDLEYDKSFIKKVHEIAVDNDEDDTVEDCEYLLKKAA